MHNSVLQTVMIPIEVKQEGKFQGFSGQSKDLEYTYT